jgi:CTP:molybdopterin cytidylyltransferase MocA
MTTAVVLAAGAGRRLGGVAKALLPYDGETFLSAIARCLTAAGARDPVIVVGPPFGDAVAEHAHSHGLRVAWNHDPDRGMASSVAIGFAALGRGYAAAWLWPVDHARVRPSTLIQLAAARSAWPATEAIAIQPRYRGRGGHPPLIDSALWEMLAAADYTNARDRLAPALRGVDVDDCGVVHDVDQPEDLA